MIYFVLFIQQISKQVFEHYNYFFVLLNKGEFEFLKSKIFLSLDCFRPEIDDRYYNALYKKLSEPEWKNSKMLSTFLNLIFKSLLKDSMESRIRVCFPDLVFYLNKISFLPRDLSNVYYNYVCLMMYHLFVVYFY
jgi:hypothetical protein